MDPIKRREFIRKTALTGAGLAGAGLSASGQAVNELNGSGQVSAPLPAAEQGFTAGSEKEPWRIHFFSKHLQFLDYAEAADACVRAGMQGADLTVRPGGHVLPENVERDLPEAVKAFREAGLTVEMMASGITDPEDPLTAKVLGTASEQGIKCYRLGYYHYDHTQSMMANLDRIRKQMAGLAKLNEKYGIHGAYQNHAGNYFGAPVWDLWEVIRDLDPQWTGCQYDICHATAEGNRSWPLGLRLIGNHIPCIVIKDFRWGERDGKAREIYVPVGDGIVDFETYFLLLKELGIQGLPVTIHLEYPMFPEKELTTAQKKDIAIELMQQDLNALRKYL
jgi:sugar phosphate isomerase/epimerase